jgi:hypothetical protein
VTDGFLGILRFTAGDGNDHCTRQFG